MKIEFSIKSALSELLVLEKINFLVDFFIQTYRTRFKFQKDFFLFPIYVSTEV